MGCITERPANNFNFISAQVANDVDISDLTGNVIFCPLIVPAPTNLVLSNITHKSIDLDWTSNSGGSETGFEIYRSLDGVSFALIHTTTSGVTNYADLGLSTNTTYYYKVRALGDIPSAYSNTASASTLFAFEFETNMTNSDTFNPNINYTGTGTPYWVFEDGSEEVGASISVPSASVGLDGTTQTVLLVIAEKDKITSMVFTSLLIVGTFDVSVFTGAAFTQIRVGSNPGLTSFVRTGLTFTSMKLYINNTAISTLPLSASDTFVELFAGSNTSLTSAPNLSSVDFVTTNAIVELSGASNLNPSLPSSITGKFVTLGLSDSGISGSFDLTDYNYQNGCTISLANNGLTSITYPDMVTNGGSILRLLLGQNNLSGNQDLSDMVGNTAVYQLDFNNNPSFTGVTPVSNYTTAKLALFDFSDTDISGTLDLSSWGAGGNASWSVDNNSSLTGFVVPSPDNALRDLLINDCDIDNFDITDLGNGGMDRDNSLYNFSDNALTAGENNQYLVDADSIYNGGFTGRVIRSEGTNAAPDSSSGGNNGTAAVASLVGKGVNVITN